jgi:phage shock protein A
VARQRCHAAEAGLSTLNAHAEAVRQEETRLALMEQQLAARIESMRARYVVLAARYNAAQAQVHLSEALAGISCELSDLRTVLECTEQETERMETRAAAIDRLVQSGILDGDRPLDGAALDGSASGRARDGGTHPAPERQTGATEL